MEKSGLNISIRPTVLKIGHRVVVIDGLKECTHELKGIGRNVNQLVVLANMGKIQEVRLGETLEALGRIYHQLRELTEQEHR